MVQRENRSSSKETSVYKIVRIYTVFVRRRTHKNAENSFLPNRNKSVDNVAGAAKELTHSRPNIRLRLFNFAHLLITFSSESGHKPRSHMQVCYVQ